MNIKSIEGNFDNTEVNKLLIKHFEELSSVSPEDRGHVLDIAGLKNPSIKFWSLWIEDKLFGCGALNFITENHGEFKSIRIADNFRNKGNGVKLINYLIREAKKLKIKKISLETGTNEFFNPARKLFNKCGFKICKPFANYKEDPDACYMTITIDS